MTIALSYLVGGLIPLAPYMLMTSVPKALAASTVVTLLALFIFGYLKGSVTGTGALNSALQTLMVGGLAAAAAFGIARLIS